MRIIALLMAVALPLAGCGSANPKEPKPTAAPTATATSTVPLPSMPPEAKEDSQAGAIAFVKHYIDVFNYASNTGNVEELQRLSDPKCEGCTKYIDLIASTYRVGGHFKDSGWSVASTKLDSASSKWGILTKIEAPTSEFQKDQFSAPSQVASHAYDLYFHVRSGEQIDFFSQAEVVDR